MATDTFDREVKARHEEMLELLESISVDDLQSEGVQLSFGGKTFKFTDLEIVEDEQLEDRIRKEYKDKLNAQQQTIREKINSKINQLLLMHQQKTQELERKEKEMIRKYRDAAMMPDIMTDHMIKGLSVVKGAANDELIWVYRALYKPAYIIAHYDNRTPRRQRKKLPSRLLNRMKQDILILAYTKGKKITQLLTKKVSKYGRLDSFMHYHNGGNQDCWGKWKYPRTWDTPNDILRICKDGEAVLETINHGSIANHEPEGLPRLNTVLKNVSDLPQVQDEVREPREDGEEFDTDEDMWHT